MKALLCHRPGTPDDLTIGELPDPVPGPGQAVVRIEATALNFFDLLIIAGQYQYKPEFPFSPGAEFAGRVESIGPSLSSGSPGFAAGDRVIGYSGWGAAREKLAIATDRLIKMPDGLDAERGAGLIVNYGTSYYALKDRA
jgi:NADPH2:quinone reductase